MRLPSNEVGISDILTYRDCPERFAFQMRRHTEGSDPPEDKHPDTLYGDAVHHGITLIERELLTDDEAVQRCFDEYGQWLDPEDADRLRADFATYRQRDASGVITVANETEIRLPLLDWRYSCQACEGTGVYDEEPCEDCGGSGDGPPETIFFRAKIDRLYQHASNPSVFIHRDYKSSKWRKTEEEVHADKQFWAYNCAIHRYWPECESLTQWYDQLRYGEIPTRKSADQRAQMWEWIQRQVRAILADEEIEPTTNEWCPWCPIMEQCPEVRRLSEWSVARIEELAGKSGKIEPESLDQRAFDEYVRDLELIARAEKMAKRYGDSVRDVLKKLPDSRLEELGYSKSERKSSYWTPRALDAVRRAVGDERFYELVTLSKTRVEKLLDPDTQKIVLGMMSKGGGALTVKKDS